MNHRWGTPVPFLCEPFKKQDSILIVRYWRTVECCKLFSLLNDVETSAEKHKVGLTSMFYWLFPGNQTINIDRFISLYHFTEDARNLTWKWEYLVLSILLISHFILMDQKLRIFNKEIIEQRKSRIVLQKNRSRFDDKFYEQHWFDLSTQYNILTRKITFNVRSRWTFSFGTSPAVS